MYCDDYYYLDQSSWLFNDTGCCVVFPVIAMVLIVLMITAIVQPENEPEFRLCMGAIVLLIIMVIGGLIMFSSILKACVINVVGGIAACIEYFKKGKPNISSNASATDNTTKNLDAKKNDSVVETNALGKESGSKIEPNPINPTNDHAAPIDAENSILSPTASNLSLNSTTIETQGESIMRNLL